MIKVESLSVQFGDFWLRDISFEVPKGGSFVLLGPSGAGKTMLLEIILGIKRPKTGQVILEGKDITFFPPEKRNISYVPQDLALFPHLSIRDNILFGLRVRKEKKNIEKRLGKVVELFKISQLLDRKNIHTLSGGEKQRVALARALITRPKVLFLDEPFSALDTYLLRQLQEEFRFLQRSLGLTVFQVTHNHDEAFFLSDQIALIFNGKIVQIETPSRLRARPTSLEAARFLMSRNEISGVIESIDAKAEKMSIRVAFSSICSCARKGLKTGQQVTLVIRPESILIKPVEKKYGTSTGISHNLESKEKLRENIFWAKVVRYLQYSNKYILYVLVEALETELEITLSPRSFYEHNLQENHVVAVFLNPLDLWPIPV